MKLTVLENTVRQHVGEFLCTQVHDEKKARVVRFSHVVTPPVGSDDVPTIGKLQDFYQTFGSALFYHDEKSGDAAKHIAPTSRWAELHGDFSDWIAPLSDEERSEILPDWIGTCLVIGETPCSGNYILVATEGAVAGKVFQFDHDGFEFTEEANDVVEYVEKLLKPDDRRLTEFASHMRFVEKGSMTQWCIRHFKDHQGHVATTHT